MPVGLVTAMFNLDVSVTFRSIKQSVGSGEDRDMTPQRKSRLGEYAFGA